MIPVVPSGSANLMGQPPRPPRGQEPRGPSVLLTVVGQGRTKRRRVEEPENTAMSTTPVKDEPSECNPLPSDMKALKVNPVNNFAVWQIRKVALSGDFWHKFVIYRGAGFTKVEIMHALVDAVAPNNLCPVMFQREGSAVTFLARNCLASIEKLIENNFRIHVAYTGPTGPEIQPLDLELVLRHASVYDLSIHVHDHLLSTITRRHDKTLRSLDLSAFHYDPELTEVVFWALWPPKALSFVLTLAAQQRNIKQLRHLSLADNELKIISPLSSLTTLEVLDLSGNKLEPMSALQPLKTLPLKELFLDRNPLCALFADEQSYIRAVKDYAPTIKKLDGVHLSTIGLPCWRRNYVPPEQQAACVALVDQFLQHYFTLLDGDDRQRLRGMYHKDCLFSLTCNYVPGQSTSSTARLTRYTMESRNLMRLSDYSKSQQLLNQGVDAVLAALCRLPRTQHDPCSFAVDVPLYNEETVMIIVHGVFREPSMMENLVRTFSRLFILKKVATKEYQIINEMLTVSNASTKQVEESFQNPRPKVALAKLSFNPAQDLTDADRSQMTRILSRLTELNQRWARKCLDESKWDIKEALLVFIEMLKMNKLPADAFQPEEDKTDTDTVAMTTGGSCFWDSESTNALDDLESPASPDPPCDQPCPGQNESLQPAPRFTPITTGGMRHWVPKPVNVSAAIKPPALTDLTTLGHNKSLGPAQSFTPMTTGGIRHWAPEPVNVPAALKSPALTDPTTLGHNKSLGPGQSIAPMTTGGYRAQAPKPINVSPALKSPALTDPTMLGQNKSVSPAQSFTPMTTGGIRAQAPKPMNVFSSLKSPALTDPTPLGQNKSLAPAQKLTPKTTGGIRINLLAPKPKNVPPALPDTSCLEQNKSLSSAKSFTPMTTGGIRAEAPKPMNVFPSLKSPALTDLTMVRQNKSLGTAQSFTPNTTGAICTQASKPMNVSPVLESPELTDPTTLGQNKSPSPAQSFTPKNTGKIRINLLAPKPKNVSPASTDPTTLGQNQSLGPAQSFTPKTTGKMCRQDPEASNVSDILDSPASPDPPNKGQKWPPAPVTAGNVASAAKTTSAGRIPNTANQITESNKTTSYYRRLRRQKHLEFIRNQQYQMPMALRSTPYTTGGRDLQGHKAASMSGILAKPTNKSDVLVSPATPDLPSLGKNETPSSAQCLKPVKTGGIRLQDPKASNVSEILDSPASPDPPNKGQKRPPAPVMAGNVVSGAKAAPAGRIPNTANQITESNKTTSYSRRTRRQKRLEFLRNQQYQMPLELRSTPITTGGSSLQSRKATSVSGVLTKPTNKSDVLPQEAKNMSNVLESPASPDPPGVAQNKTPGPAQSFKTMKIGGIHVQDPKDTNVSVMLETPATPNPLGLGTNETPGSAQCLKPVETEEIHLQDPEASNVSDILDTPASPDTPDKGQKLPPAPATAGNVASETKAASAEKKPNTANQITESKKGAAYLRRQRKLKYKAFIRNQQQQNSVALGSTPITTGGSSLEDHKATNMSGISAKPTNKSDVLPQEAKNVSDVLESPKSPDPPGLGKNESPGSAQCLKPMKTGDIPLQDSKVTSVSGVLAKPTNKSDVLPQEDKKMSDVLAKPTNKSDVLPQEDKKMSDVLESPASPDLPGLGQNKISGPSESLNTIKIGGIPLEDSKATNVSDMLESPASPDPPCPGQNESTVPADGTTSRKVQPPPVPGGKGGSTANATAHPSDNKPITPAQRRSTRRRKARRRAQQLRASQQQSFTPRYAPPLFPPTYIFL